MKKITLLVAVFATSLSAFAQDYYNFTKSTSTYADLTNATSMNNGVSWDWDDFGPVTTPFPVTVFGQTFNNFTFEDDFFYLGDLWNTVDAIVLYPINGYIMDRDFSLNGPSLSPISYKVEGTTGSRILKLEVKNAGLEMEEEISSTSSLYLNYQIWFYESDNSVEYHYGAHNITNLNMLNEDAFSSVFLAYMTDVDFQGGYVDGTIASPFYVETDDQDDEPVGLDAVPAANTVYRFAVNPLAIKDQEKVEFAVYPNPTAEFLNISFQENIEKEYAVYDMIGRNILSGKVNNENTKQINVSALQNGTYILKVGGSTKTFIKK